MRSKTCCCTIGTIEKSSSCNSKSSSSFYVYKKLFHVLISKFAHGSMISHISFELQSKSQRFHCKIECFLKFHYINSNILSNARYTRIYSYIYVILFQIKTLIKFQSFSHFRLGINCNLILYVFVLQICQSLRLNFNNRINGYWIYI